MLAFEAIARQRGGRGAPGGLWGPKPAILNRLWGFLSRCEGAGVAAGGGKFVVTVLRFNEVAQMTKRDLAFWDPRLRLCPC